MTKRRFQFSLRTLLIATTVLAVATAMLANHMDFMIAIAMFALWLLDIGSWLSWFGTERFSDLQGRKTTEQVHAADSRKISASRNHLCSVTPKN